MVKDKEKIICPDPFIIRWKNDYYCYCSGEDGIRVFFSHDLDKFEDMGYVYKVSNEHSFWAPCVIEIKGIFYLYYSSLKENEYDDHSHFLKVISSNSPLGPFKNSVTLTNKFCIDPHVIKKSGKYIIFYAANINENPEYGRMGTAIWRDELESPCKLSGNEETILFPSIDQEIFMKNRFGDGVDWHTLEGPFYMSDGEESWLMYSGNAYTSPDYFINYAIEDSSSGKLKYYKQPSDRDYLPLVKGNSILDGTGHNSITRAPDHITPILVYHGRSNNFEKNEGEDRVLCLDKIWREGNILKTSAPGGNEELILPKADINFLDNYSKNGEVYKLKSKITFNLPDSGSYYIEGCFKAENKDTYIYLMEGKKIVKKIEIEEGDYWQTVGILVFNGFIKLKIEEEWIGERILGVPGNLVIHTFGELEIIYLDCTFVRDIYRNIPCYLL